MAGVSDRAGRAQAHASTEIMGAVTAMRARDDDGGCARRARSILCGTGGDGLGTLNISTRGVFRGGGVRRACRQAWQSQHVLAHGRRRRAGGPGREDRHLHRKPRAPACARPGCVSCLRKTYHPAMKHVTPVRRALGFRTIFNLLGPLSNPARVKRQLLGVYALEWMEPVARCWPRSAPKRPGSCMAVTASTK